MPAIVPRRAVLRPWSGPAGRRSRSSAASSRAPAQCSAASSPRLCPTATVGLDPERGQDPQPGHRRGDDARLGDLGGHDVAGGRQRRVDVDLLGLVEPAAQGPAGDTAAGALAREEEADLPRPVTWPRKLRPSLAEVAGAALVEDLAQPASGARRLPRVTRRRPPPGRAGHAARRAASRPGRPARRRRAWARTCDELVELLAQLLRRRGVGQQQLGVLQRGEPGPGRGCPSACGGAARRLSSTTWVLMPPNPMAETPARTGGPRARPRPCAAPAARRAAPAEHARAGRRSRAGRQDLVVDGQRGLDQPGDPGGGLGVADVGLDRADRGGRRVRVRLAAGRGQGGELGGVADRACRCRAPRSSATVSMPKPARSVGAAQRQLMPLGLRPGDAALAVGGDAPAADRWRRCGGPAARASGSRISTTMPQPSPGQKPLERAS